MMPDSWYETNLYYDAWFTVCWKRNIKCLVIEATELFVPTVLLDASSKRRTKNLGVLCNILILAHILLSLKLSSNKIVIS